ncbi:hypothetical protein [Streptomyces xantholiticus]|uniref:hypothetical protein n=1 Tax=Streptomyces xantholiticus TaxID=68285 RepID=UPI001677F104|nr:hypothetical protein [Streptomyces xantholiticus]GGW73654.1 hypothetical protein GCM10010381_67970 [Streptomyces xantholiticus]
MLDGRPRARATAVSWRRGGADVALLRLDAAVEGARPAPLVDGTGVWGHTFRAFGYPAGAERGVWASGTLRVGQGSVPMAASSACIDGRTEDSPSAITYAVPPATVIPQHA